MIVDLAQVRTADGLTLDGVLLPADGDLAVVVSPGTAMRFSQPPMFDLAQALAARGVPALSLSTRGNGLMWRDAGSRRKNYGAAFEDIRECTLDFDAAIGWLVDRGYRRVATIGHSLGGTKVLYHAAHDPHPALAGTVSIDGPRWSASVFRASDGADRFEEHCRRAATMIAEGRGDDLMEMTYPVGPLPITAKGYLDKYGDEHFNVATWGQGIRVPVLRVDAVGNQGIIRDLMVGVAEDISRLAPNPHHQAVRIDTDHNFTGRTDDLADTITGWLRSLPA